MLGGGLLVPVCAVLGGRWDLVCGWAALPDDLPSRFRAGDCRGLPAPSRACWE